jgi:hypothetical protein
MRPFDAHNQLRDERLFDYAEALKPHRQALVV